ncbi:hypothetical protein LBMAG53_37840 [Planctomycetota bacterium]|nr:hypothetical protein LBMAG53_37840 [Planctomycetota bacterium]
MTRDQLDLLSDHDLRELGDRYGISSDLLRPELLGLLASRLASGTALAVPALAEATSSNIQRVPVASDGPNPGLPIPPRYGRDRLVLMVQDPGHLFAYWEVTPSTLDRVRSDISEPGQPVLVILGPTGEEQREVDLLGGNYYLAVASTATYEARLALRDRHGRLHTLAGSNLVSTPAAGPSWRTDEDWMVVDERFHELVARAGLPGEGGSSGLRLGGSEVRLRARTIDQRRLGWDWQDTAHAKVWSSSSLGEGSAAAPITGGFSSHLLAGPGALGSNQVVTLSSLENALSGAWSASQSSGALVPRIGSSGALGSSEWSGRLLSSRALSSRALSSTALSSTARFEIAAPLPLEVLPAVAAAGHDIANAPLAAVAASPVRQAGHQAAQREPSEPQPVHPGPWNPPAASQPEPATSAAPQPEPAAPSTPGYLRGVDTIKQQGKKPLPPAVVRVA